jgi:hypothetical protein
MRGEGISYPACGIQILGPACGEGTLFPLSMKMRGAAVVRIRGIEVMDITPPVGGGPVDRLLDEVTLCPLRRRVVRRRDTWNVKLATQAIERQDGHAHAEARRPRAPRSDGGGAVCARYW